MNRGWVQLALGLVLAVALPVLARFAFAEIPSLAHYGAIDFPKLGGPIANSIAGTFLAVLGGFYFYRALSQFPGSSTVALIAPIFLATFLIVVTGFFLLKLDYVRGQFIASFALSMAWFHLIHIYVARQHVRRVGVVPFGEVGSLASDRTVEWVKLQRPKPTGERWSCIVADLRASMPPEWERFLADKALAGTPIYHIKQIRESLSGKVTIEHLSENNFGSLVPGRAYLQIKVAIDILIAVGAFFWLLPSLALIALLVRLDSPGPILFRQERVGYRGQIFKMYKFRTMEHRSPVGDCERTSAITVDDDPRITRVGSFLRRTRLDELPQIINILRGEMSWIGPRPEAVALSQWYEKELPFYRYRHIVRPGISGWAQVNQGHVADVHAVWEKLQYDFYYIKFFSAWLDLVIMLRTCRVMFTGHGAR